MESGPSDRIRTCGILLPKQARYQLRYTRLFSLFIRLVVFSQTRRDTNFAIPGYSISAMIPRRAVKIKIFLSVVIHVVKATFMPFSAIGANPANTGVTRLCGVSPHPIPDTTTALPKQARYQLRYTRLLSFLSGWAYSPKPGAIPTALHPDTVFTLHRKSVFDSPNSILDFGRKVNRPVAYPARIAYNKNITQYIKERAL